MKKTKIKDVIQFFPLTVQNATILNRKKWKEEISLVAKNYQSDKVNSQQLNKPISKIIRFQ